MTKATLIILLLAVVSFVVIKTGALNYMLDSEYARAVQSKHNPLLDIPPREFWEATRAVVDSYDNGEACTSMWAKGDRGSKDCEAVALAVAAVHKTRASFVYDHDLWDRYQIQDYKGRRREFVKEGLGK